MFGKLLAPGPKYSWRKVSWILALSTFCVSGIGAAVQFFYHYTQELHGTNETSVIQTVVQTSALYAPLQTSYLSEVLELAVDRPVHFTQFDLDEAHERLMATHVIRQALIKKIKPNLLYIDYETRVPVAYLGDYTNTALDKEGVLFPYLPFFSPRRLPKVYLGAQAPPNPWGKRLSARNLQMAMEILERFRPGEVEQLDLSQSEAPSAGTRQIILVLKGGAILRLTPKSYAQELTCFQLLAPKLDLEEISVIDFRNPHVAYIARRN